MVVAMSSILLIGLAVAILAYLLLSYLQRFRLYKESAKFPGPTNLPFIGSAHYFLGSTQGIYNFFFISTIVNRSLN